MNTINSSTECDGMTQICHTVLLREAIPHVCMVGVCCYGARRLPAHLWIDLLDDLQGYRIDYRARLWLGDFSDIPHGVFRPQEFPKVSYEGSPRVLPSLSNHLFKVLTAPRHQAAPKY
jgi:hypothetical protein